MLYVNADGHHHWHLQHVAKYSLWNSEKTAEVAPAEKVGFCLEDSEQVEVEPHGEKGPARPVYSDEVPPGRDFCQRFRPNVTSVYEGISPGWRDEYASNLGFQWVDTSDVLPGEYWLREEVNPERTIAEEGVGSKVAYATEPTIIPGFDAQAQTTGAPPGQAATITLSSQSFEDSALPAYTIVDQPLHGTLGAVTGDHVTYTPNPGYAGPDSFTFSASDPNSEFPRSPAVATVSIEVGPAQAASVASTVLPVPAILPVPPPAAPAPTPSGSSPSGSSSSSQGLSRPQVTADRAHADHDHQGERRGPGAAQRLSRQARAGHLRDTDPCRSDVHVPADARQGGLSRRADRRAGQPAGRALDPAPVTPRRAGV
jgi:hypothetical protein